MQTLVSQASMLINMFWAWSGHAWGAVPPRCHLAADVGTNRRHLAADVGTDRSTCTWVKIYASEYIISLLLKKSFIKYKSFYLYFNLNYLCAVIFTSSSALMLDAASWVG